MEHRVKSSIYLIIGDTSSKLQLNGEQKILKIQTLWHFPIVFTKSLDQKYYFSEPIEMNIKGVSKYFSREGDISYFPRLKTIGINLEDEENTLGMERYNLGRLEGNLLMIQRLKKTEEVQIKFVFKDFLY